jgi:hypothetical protein
MTKTLQLSDYQEYLIDKYSLKNIDEITKHVEIQQAELKEFHTMLKKVSEPEQESEPKSEFHGIENMKAFRVKYPGTDKKTNEKYLEWRRYLELQKANSKN